MKKLVRSARRVYKQDGPVILLRKSIRYVIAKIVPDRLLAVWVTRSLSPRGWYRINPTGTKSIDIYSTASGGAARKRIQGELEPQVMDELIRRTSEDMQVWDVGAAWGYFTNIIASMGATVTAFEVVQGRSEIIKEGATRNNWADRVTVVNGKVGSEISLDNFETPDLIKMDIEGWEYEAIQPVLETLSGEPTWIVEIHEPSMVSDKVPAKSGIEIKNLFESHGYELVELKQRNESNYHIVAEKK